MSGSSTYQKQGKRDKAARELSPVQQIGLKLFTGRDWFKQRRNCGRAPSSVELHQKLAEKDEQVRKYKSQLRNLRNMLSGVSSRLTEKSGSMISSKSDVEVIRPLKPSESGENAARDSSLRQRAS